MNQGYAEHAGFLKVSWSKLFFNLEVTVEVTWDGKNPYVYKVLSANYWLKMIEV